VLGEARRESQSEEEANDASLERLKQVSTVTLAVTPPRAV